MPSLCSAFFCADFIDYMERIQIAAQECNVRFSNPIVGILESHDFFFIIVSLYILSVALLAYKATTIGRKRSKSLSFLPKLNMKFSIFSSGFSSAVKTTSLQSENFICATLKCRCGSFSRCRKENLCEYLSSKMAGKCLDNQEKA